MAVVVVAMPVGGFRREGTPSVLVTRYGVIAREESYLSRKFGADYHDYTMRVPRWL